MNLCVFGASSNQIGQIYLNASEKLGTLIGQRGHTLIFGGGGMGVMGSVAKGVKTSGGHVIGVVPRFMDVDGICFKECDELLTTESMHERKAEMETRADAFIVCPGGIGTFEELFEVLSLKQLQRHEKAIIILNTEGYYNGLWQLLEHSIHENFVRDTCRVLYSFVSSPEEAIAVAESYRPSSQFSDGLRSFSSPYTYDSVKENE